MDGEVEHERGGAGRGGAITSPSLSSDSRIEPDGSERGESREREKARGLGLCRPFRELKTSWVFVCLGRSAFFCSLV
jgi:hypothetical protein